MMVSVEDIASTLPERTAVPQHEMCCCAHDDVVCRKSSCDLPTEERAVVVAAAPAIDSTCSRIDKLNDRRCRVQACRNDAGGRIGRTSSYPQWYLPVCLLCILASTAAWSSPPACFRSAISAPTSQQGDFNRRIRRLHPLLYLSTSKQSASSRAASKANSAKPRESTTAALNSQLNSLRQALDQRSLDTQQSMKILEDMVKHTQQTSDTTNYSAIIKAFREVSNYSFSYPYDTDKIYLGISALKLELSTLSSIPRSTWLKALRALTSNEINRLSSSSIPSLNTNHDQHITPPDAAFQILQRLITQRGVLLPSNKHQKHTLDERDFNMVLHAYAIQNRISDAHRILALQERTPYAPPLSPVPYSILLKAYGQRGDVKNVEMCVQHSMKNKVIVDIVMVNSILDAYVNCGCVDMAEELFYSLTNNGDDDETRDTYYWTKNKNVRPNVRSYNTMLKGWALEGKLNKAMKLSKIMKRNALWDDITTNTLVKVAVSAQQFHVAEELLTNHTSSNSIDERQHYSNDDHPNIEAYTELIDGYAKDGQLEKALELMSTMQQRHVSPNEYTYTCVVGALARGNKVRQAKKMIDYVTSLNFPYSKRGKRVLTPVFNAFISGLLSSDVTGEDNNAQQQQQGGMASHSLNILVALNTLSEMEKLEVYPNVVTVTLLIDGLANCNPPRVKEAKELVQHLEYTTRRQQMGRSQDSGTNFISPSNTRIGTALVRAYGRANDVESAVDAFRRIAKPDVVALNALLDACCKSGNLKLAFEMFDRYASFDKWRDDGLILDEGPLGEELRRRAIHPDVVTYTTLITSVLQLNNKNVSKRATKLYNDMKQVWRISPDTVLVDKILYTMTSGGSRGFEEADIQFTLQVLRDGEQLPWEGNQYAKRKKAVRAVLMACSSEVWKVDELTKNEPDDPLFLKKGWNKIDSGFRLWGSGVHDGEGENKAGVDEFLAKKGWNDMDSGFRII